ncbi:GDP-fucose protein O-fucosyltransferase 2 isoform X1 [Cephus cinctus]|uniref:GDP-fucose protein O-fucosyltransferase 2 n=1 Tax=Cephus cinctus TaxID=211228 RepID=A0AAJ7RIZ9_CEPCN|nr:GDP-fucose protein O-fucosyltransferase 2 isoform X1 [Cephus cinctus]XP_024941371.1 GDP-fucose protein O-fucosyltransferase 2 isoform X1 [Cephus cinctus]
MYILYDVNLPEGFNLRRDVYIRAAVFLRNLIDNDTKYDWQLVLPPWGNLYHWRSMNIGMQKYIPWATFFDIVSLQKYIPVLEMYEFMKEYSVDRKEIVLDRVYFLQHDENMFSAGKFVDKNEVASCPENNFPYRKINDKFAGRFWGYSNITALEVKCIIFHGTTFGLMKNLKPSIHRSFMFDHMEIALHKEYGSVDYWMARRSMRYNSELYNVANEFRKKYLNSDDKKDNTERPDDWTMEKGKRNAVGGQYLAVHLRRRDFLMGRKDTVPTIKSAASQLKKKLKELKLETVFVATDAKDHEYEDLVTQLRNYTVIRFSPTDYIRTKFKDGGLAIIDQIICSYARYFIGTYESTFTFRIQEDREILGFLNETTFNYLCGTKNKCETGGRWTIVW